MAGLDAVAEQVEHVALVDRRGGQDARARRGAGDLGDREPFAARERRGRVEPEAAAADRLPMLAGRVAAAREAVGEGEGDGLAELVACAPRLVAGAPCPILRHAPCGLGARALVGAPAAVAQLEVGVVAAKAALGEQGRGLRRRARRNRARPASISMCARRGSSGKPAMARPCGGQLAVFVERAQRASAARALRRAPAAGGGSRKGRRAGSASPHSRQASSRPDRSASRISGGSCAGSEPVAASSHRRMATPGPWRAARPARWVTAARLARSVTRRVRPAPRS